MALRPGNRSNAPKPPVVTAMSVLLGREFSWPDLAGRKVLLVALGEGDAGTGALAGHPAVRAAARVDLAELRPPRPSGGEELVRRTSSGRLGLTLEPGLSGELARLEQDFLLFVDLGGPPDLETPRAVLDLLRRSGRDGMLVLVGPGAQGSLEAEALEGVLAALALTENFSGSTSLEALRLRLRRVTGPSVPERVAGFLGNLGAKPGEVDNLGRVRAPAGAFPWLPPDLLARMLVFHPSAPPVLGRDEALALLPSVSEGAHLEAVARAHPEPRVRLQAAAAVSSERVWGALLGGDPDPRLRREAARHVRKIPVLMAAASGDEDAEVRALVRRRLQDQGQLPVTAGERVTRLLLALAPMRGLARRSPRLAGAVVLLGLGALAYGGWLLHGSWKASEAFQTGTRLLEKGDSAGLLWVARAVKGDPSQAAWRETASTLLLGRPSLVFGRPLGGAEHVAVGPDGSTVARASGRTLVLSEPLEMPAPVTDLSFAPDDGTLAVALEVGGVRVLGTGGEARVLPHPAPVTRVRAGAGGRIATVDRDGTFRLWQGDRLLGQAPSRGTVTALDADRGRWGALDEGDVEVRTLGRPEPSTLAHGAQPFRDVRLDPVGERLATLDTRGIAELWEPLTMGWSRRNAGRDATSLEFLPGGREVVVLEGSVARVTRTGGAPRPHLVLLPPGTTRLAFSADGSTVAAWGAEGVHVARSTALVRELDGTPDLDEPPHLLELEAWLYTGRSLGRDGSAGPLGKADLALAWEEWEREGAAHARSCEWPSANLWLLMRR